MKMEKLRIRIKVEGDDIKIKKMLKGKKEMGEVMKKLMRRKWEDVLRELKKEVEEEIKRILKKKDRKVLERLKLEEIFKVE